MLKTFLNKLSRKSKLDSEGDSSRSTASPRGVSGRSHRQHGGGGGGSSAAAKRASASAVFPASMVSGIEPLVPFNDVPNSEKMNLFVSKLSLCCVTFDFSDPGKNIVEKDLKRRTLFELVDFVSCGGSMKFSEHAILAMCKMFAINLFRVFPPNYRANGGVSENDDDELMFDPAWPHLQIVYELMVTFISSSCLDAKVAKKYIDHSFISKLLDLFESDDPRERDCLKTILHRVYGKFMVHRPFIRKSMSNIFYQFVFETEKHNGIAELLEVFGSVISGFALPLKEEHKIFLWRVLIPLHKPKSMDLYFQPLSYCITLFIEKETKLASIVINGLLKYWPVTNSQKEVMFLGELEEILDVINMVEFQRVMVPLFLRIGCCINSLHFQVAERALYLWNNDHIVNLIAHNRQVILPIIFPALDSNVHSHWNPAVMNLTHNVRKMFLEIDEKLYISCHSHFKEDEAILSAEAEKRKEAWKQLERAASLKPVTGNTAVLVSPLMT
ncbi:hypothetical protein TanjilG_01241 [Lupinus angustifolius]|uniref:Serine/threonine protein phosphatase 2A regulatory subunit n=1 Tax=Lupinus angustifolius TaxID=3871 RepID=A0A4P1RF35_LUPAN|nr:PREDICTED: serine/threonine protein phosphatase 2A 57 kDa regulatory subunit B' iota isoform-like [Lupinus angustifolius]XP_019447529.1 PREDICTED: serine/threonine protein phosphatase 2A 57 kDa regulatory subunit B' iota isoform-like [Lupinus angustifolius]OIW09270.1 hypothetical protein TanjilG_01241 [Lupinus angustifolius]